jgi:hypothetical protein
MAGSFNSHLQLQTISNGSIAESSDIAIAIISIFLLPCASHKGWHRIIHSPDSPDRPPAFPPLRFSVAAETNRERSFCLAGL